MQEKIMEQTEAPVERLYYQDSHMHEFTATVLACEEDKKGFRVVLDRTAFFPEGGGQFGDIGWLAEIECTGRDGCGNKIKRGETCKDTDQNGGGNHIGQDWFGAADNGGIREAAESSADLLEEESTMNGNANAKQRTAVVLDTKEKRGLIYHMTDRPLTVGAKVAGKIDFEERFVRMQQHTGEHIISGIVHSLYGYDNVGFHLGADITTLDFNGELTPEQVHEVEVLSNKAVFANIPVEILYPTKEELAVLEYRSKIDIEGQVRIVNIPGIDMCACCAPHMSTTGEIGLIKILACDKHRGGCRMTMVSGMRALADYEQKQRSVTEVSVALSAKPEAIGEAVLNQKAQMQNMREHLNQLQASYLAQKLDEIAAGQENVCIFVEAFDNIAVRNFVNDAMERCEGICAAFVGTDESGYHYILGSRHIDVREFAKKLNAAFGGKGGGKPEMVQGSLSGNQEEIREMCESAQV